METNRGMDKGLYERERAALLASIAECRAGKHKGTIGGRDKNEVYIEGARAALCGIYRQRYAKPGTRAFRHRHR
jgi:hypothetical protein